MKALILGGGGREHVLAWKIAQSEGVSRVFCAPGNPGIARMAKGTCVPIDVMDFDALDDFIVSNGIVLIVVGPEAPLAGGAVDRLSKPGRFVFGPTQAAAQLEASKSFAKAFMARHAIPTASYAEFTDADAAVGYVREQGAPIVIKADGLAAGKGVTVAQTIEDAEAAIDDTMRSRQFGEAGPRVVVEEFLAGEEASILAFCDGATVLPLTSSQDHKPAYDGDAGPNTGGMGAYSPAPVVTPELAAEIEERILKPCVRGMASEGTPFRGLLYAGLMIAEDGPKVVEFNVRFGDPEAQAVLPRVANDIVPLLTACCDGTLTGRELTYGPAAAVTVVMASGGYPGEYDQGKPIAGLDAAEAAGCVVFHAGTREDEGAIVTSGGRVLAVTAVGDDLAETIERAYAGVDAIHFDGAHYRTDIGQKALDRSS